ncbi:hypothetical protein TOPH_04788 [Tolypocladium ophioglossoides CBS 100239]|uniref:F-box domain-containing protein n=1 Tax=Tolypocladium ophioglossoides (strain CBS 100239) TaxID=1163406 RepID=A0A0L0N951_TOLOC|nr:hypothetical protein TOPH_04788 [Tolypocladium ophioglossoides CBS 100239]
MDTATSLGSLPDHLLLDVVEYLDTARDVSHLGSSSRRTHNLIHHDGWKTFVRTRFPSLAVPSSDSTGWGPVADRLTYLDRCWERRAFIFNYFQEAAQKRERGYRHGQRPRHGQSVRFQSVVDAQLVSSTQHEMLACGAGEDLFVRWRATDGTCPGTWRSLLGRETGYAAGTGDVTAVSAIERDSRPEVIVGRANGDVQLLSAADDDSFGQPVKRLLPLDHGEVNPRSSPGQLAVTWTEWQPQAQMIARCRSSLLALYNLSSEDEAELKPMVYYNASKDERGGDASLVLCAKFMGSDTIACGIGGSSEPLRWGKIRPTGLELSPATYYSDGQAYSAFTAPRGTVRAIEPIGGAKNEHLLLSAWDDGSYRLLDMRTPSSHDAVYRDRFQPYHAGSSLLVYGTERFVAGGNREPVLRLFDFRCPKPYFHFSALPCSDRSPAPEHPEVAQMRSHGRQRNRSTLPAQQPPSAAPSDRCDLAGAGLCSWHAQSRQPSWRPDATMYLSADNRGPVFSLAKASDLSGSLYCGLRGEVAEATLTLAGDITQETAKRTAPPGWMMTGGERAPSDVTIVETGISRCHSEGWMGTDPMASVGLYNHHPFGSSQYVLRDPPERSRLDSSVRKREGSSVDGPRRRFGT